MWEQAPQAVLYGARGTLSLLFLARFGQVGFAVQLKILGLVSLAVHFHVVEYLLVFRDGFFDLSVDHRDLLVYGRLVGRP